MGLLSDWLLGGLCLSWLRFSFWIHPANSVYQEVNSVYCLLFIRFVEILSSLNAASSISGSQCDKDDSGSIQHKESPHMSSYPNEEHSVRVVFSDSETPLSIFCLNTHHKYAHNEHTKQICSDRNKNQQVSHHNTVVLNHNVWVLSRYLIRLILCYC